MFVAWIVLSLLPRVHAPKVFPYVYGNLQLVKEYKPMREIVHRRMYLPEWRKGPSRPRPKVSRMKYNFIHI